MPTLMAEEELPPVSWAASFSVLCQGYVKEYWMVLHSAAACTEPEGCCQRRMSHTGTGLHWLFRPYWKSSAQHRQPD